MGVKVVQLTSKCHHESILASLDQLRLHRQLSDITVQVEYQGDVQEFQAHQVMLAASSGYFRNILLSEDAVRDKLSLYNMHSSDFSAFLEFVYTGKVEVARDKIVDVQAAAQFLDCEELSEVCIEAMSGGSVLRSPAKTSEAACVDEDGGSQAAQRSKAKIKKAPLKRLLFPQSSDKDGPSKRLKAKSGAETEKMQGKKLKFKLAGRKVLQREIGLEKMEGEEAVEESEALASAEEAAEKADKDSMASSNVDDDNAKYDMDVQINDPDDMLSLGDEEEEEMEGEEEEEEDDGAESGVSKRTSKAQFQCNKCQRTFHYERSYLKHISTYHGVKAEVVYRCETCQQTFANRSNLKIHEKHVHNNERLFSCEACAKTFKRKKDVVRHHRQVHERNSLRHVCPECGKSLSSRTALMLHERTHTGAKPFECTDCGARFTQNSALKMHHRIHTGEKPFACDQCDARFTQKHMLSYHKRSHSGEKPFMCEACGKSFASKEYLRHHSNIHTGSKPYKCELCGRGFAQRNSLHQHSKIHTGERPYSCKHCDKHFTQLNALQRHQRIHTGEKPYMCGLCRRTFTDKSTLRRHTMIHDSDAPWKTYLVVLEGNVEDKKPKESPQKGKTEKAAATPRKGGGKKSGGGDTAGVSIMNSAAAVAPGAVVLPEPGKAHADSIILPEQVTLPPDWTSHGAIALVSHGALGGITVIHTEVPAGTQIQPIVTTDASGASVLALDSSAIPVPFSIPVSMAHPIPLSADAASALSIPVPDGTLALVSETPVVPASSSVLEAAASQTILAPVSGSPAAAGAEAVHPDIETVIVGDHISPVKGDEPERAADEQSPKPDELPNDDSQ